ncbi:MAG: ATPase [Acidobacteria bacterium]|nr:ATPase [Acidobacteriota bacterium]MBI3425311.1 ATPase [Acidobacteriota bacterium]
MAYFLGIDGGQSHTTALVADAQGRIVGCGHAGASNHTRAPGGRERLTNAVNQAVGTALRQAGLIEPQEVRAFRFVSAYLALTGVPEDKVAIVNELLSAEFLKVDHDAPGALAGAHAGQPGVIVLAGTGSVACGEAFDTRGARRYVRVGGRGYLFADEGSAFAIARQALALALRRADRVDGYDELQTALLEYFARPDLPSISEDVYADVISRDQLAGFAVVVAALAERSVSAAQPLLDQAADDLAELAEAVTQRLQASEPLAVSYHGGVFKSTHLFAQFRAALARRLPHARLVTPRFTASVGALLLAYRQAGITITPQLLDQLERFAITFMGAACAGTVPRA